MAAALRAWLRQHNVHELDVDTVLAVLHTERISTLSELTDTASKPELLDELARLFRERLKSRLAAKRLELALRSHVAPTLQRPVSSAASHSRHSGSPPSVPLRLGRSD
eukprot:3467109-Prymnesium_polylepis.1